MQRYAQYLARANIFYKISPLIFTFLTNELKIRCLQPLLQPRGRRRIRLCDTLCLQRITLRRKNRRVIQPNAMRWSYGQRLRQLPNMCAPTDTARSVARPAMSTWCSFSRRRMFFSMCSRVSTSRVDSLLISDMGEWYVS